MQYDTQQIAGALKRGYAYCTASRLRIVASAGAAVLVVVAILQYALLSAPEGSAPLDRYVIKQGTERGALIEEVAADGYVRNAAMFSLLLDGPVEAGVYHISREMNALEIAGVFEGPPDRKWVMIPEGFRIEQIAERLADELRWNDTQVQQFIAKDARRMSELPEGVFFPDTYLISPNASTTVVAKRLHNRFNEQFREYASAALEQNIRWPTLLTVASLVQREADGTEDMPVIAGVIWNRLKNSMRLEVDATVQYARDTLRNYSFGEKCAFADLGSCSGWRGSYHGRYADENGWWSPISIRNKELQPFNTYRNDGLPPWPIANPGTDAIEAALYPADTSCFYYLHERDGTLRCAATYDGHLDNVREYL